LNHPDWLIEPDDDIAGRGLALIDEVDRHRLTLHNELLGVQQQFRELTEQNLSVIYERLTGESVTDRIQPYSPLEFDLALADYDNSYHRREARDEVSSLRDEVSSLRDEVTRLESTINDLETTINDLESAADDAAAAPQPSLSRLGTSLRTRLKDIGDATGRRIPGVK
ncbi:MAG: hypothetical protein AAGG08_21375, partial [Actinomycetota bacterium]